MAFELMLLAADGPLPQDTSLTVKHLTGEETFRLDQAFPDSDVVFCSRCNRDRVCPEVTDSALDADSGPPPVEAMLCRLWTDGTARVTVVASGYPRLEQRLDVKFNDGCLETKDVVLTLERRDAGP